MIWTSGIKTWKKLAKKGYWVNGSSDSLGEENPKINYLSKNKKWVKLTHNLTQKIISNLITALKMLVLFPPMN